VSSRSLITHHPDRHAADRHRSRPRGAGTGTPPFATVTGSAVTGSIGADTADRSTTSEGRPMSSGSIHRIPPAGLLSER
jgi:hypothetical protein